MRRLLVDGPQPQALPEDFVAALTRAVGTDGLSTAAPADLQPGDAVRITASPFTECAAVVLRLAPGGRVEVLLEVLGGRVPARLPRRAIVAAA